MNNILNTVPFHKVKRMTPQEIKYVVDYLQNLIDEHRKVMIDNYKSNVNNKNIVNKLNGNRWDLT